VKRRLDPNNIHGIADYPVPGVTDDDVMKPAGGCGRYCMTNFPSLPRYLIASQHLVSLATNATLLMHSLTSPALESACAS